MCMRKIITLLLLLLLLILRANQIESAWIELYRLNVVLWDDDDELISTWSDVGSVCWMSPESIATRTYSKKSDTWSFGIVGINWIHSTPLQSNPIKLKQWHITTQIDCMCCFVIIGWIKHRMIGLCLIVVVVFVFDSSLWNCFTKWTTQRNKESHWNCSCNSVCWFFNPLFHCLIIIIIYLYFYLYIWVSPIMSSR